MSIEPETPVTQAGKQDVAPAETVTANPPPETSAQAADVEPLDLKYKRLKELDELLDYSEEQVDVAQFVKQEALKEFAALCREIWQTEKKQGSRKEKGFRRALKAHGIKVGRAYRAMKKFFGADFPAKPKPTATSSVANEVPGRQPIVQFTGKALPDGMEILECVFPFTSDEKAEFLENLQLIGEEEAKRVFVGAVKQAAGAMRGQQADPSSEQPGLEAAQAASGPTEFWDCDWCDQPVTPEDQSDATHVPVHKACLEPWLHAPESARPNQAMAATEAA